MNFKKPSSLHKIKTQKVNQKAILCLHGLNQNPESLYPLLKDIEDFGYNPYLLKLPGHSEGFEVSAIKKEIIIQEYKKSYEYLKSIYGDEIHLIGYSFGGLIAVNLLDEITYKKIILIAPALKMKPYSFAIQFVLPFLKKVRSIPFFKEEIEKKYRYHQQGVPREIYISFFEILKDFSKKDVKSFNSTQALVFCHPKDELIHFKNLWKWLGENTLWDKIVLDNSRAILKKFNHLCFDQETLGEDSYKKMVNKIKSFLLD